MFKSVDELTNAIAPVIETAIKAAVADLQSEVESLKKKLKELPIPRDGQDGNDGKDAEVDYSKIHEFIKEQISLLPKPENGKDAEVDYDKVTSIIKNEVSLLPVPKDGKDAEIDYVYVKSLIAEEVQKLPPPKDGNDGKDAEIDYDKLASIVEKEVEKLPKAKDGQDGTSFTINDAQPIINDAVKTAINQLPEPITIRDTLINRDGDLIVTYSNGETKNLGAVAGKDGEDGRDGFGFDDIDVKVEDRKLKFIFNRGDEIKVFSAALSTPLDMGVFSEDKTYQKGDGVSFGGSFWIAQRATTEKPGKGNDWRLAVKKGRDGRDGKLPTPKPETFKLGA